MGGVGRHRTGQGQKEITIYFKTFGRENYCNSHPHRIISIRSEKLEFLEKESNPIICPGKVSILGNP